MSELEFEVVEGVPPPGPRGKYVAIIAALARGEVVRIPVNDTPSNSCNALRVAARAAGLRITVRASDGSFYVRKA